MKMDRNAHTEWTDLLSGFLDGDLDAATFEALEEHLAGCGACRLVLEELQAVVAGAGALGGIEPPRDLWAGIAATLRAPAPEPESETRVIAFPSPPEVSGTGPRPVTGASVGQERRDAPRRVVLSRPQLAAASIALVAISSMATWVAGPGLGVRTAPDARPASVAGGDVSMAAVGDVAVAPELAEEVASLERTLAEARAVLDPNTVRVLERNLAVIEGAIEDSRRALEIDPGNAFLAHHLERVYERKREYLREAVRAAEWTG